jgi:hypothetical protein
MFITSISLSALVATGLIISCAKPESKYVTIAKRNVIRCIKDIPGIKKYEIIAAKEVKSTKDAIKFLKRRGIISQKIKADYGDIVVVARIHRRLKWMGKIIIFVCDCRGRPKYLIERKRPKHPFVRGWW